MFSLTCNFKTIAITKEILNINPYLISSQTVRWRKPRWIPKAKTKIFKIPPRHVIPEDEAIELKRLNNNYNTQIKSIRKYLYDNYNYVNLSQTDPEEHRKEFEKDIAHCTELNNEWNEKQKEMREKRVADELEAELDTARKTVEMELLKQEQTMELIEEMVRKEKDYSKHYITPENIDDAIEQALNNTVDYNFTVNLKGEKIVGFEKKEEQEASASQ